MENLTVLIISGFGTVLFWLALSHIQQGKKIVALSTMMAGLEISISSVKNTLDTLGTRIDLLLKTEIDTLKEIARSVNKNHR